MESPIFDTHAHYSARAFDSDRFALLDSCLFYTSRCV